MTNSMRDFVKMLMGMTHDMIHSMPIEKQFMLIRQLMDEYEKDKSDFLKQQLISAMMMVATSLMGYDYKQTQTYIQRLKDGYADQKIKEESKKPN